MEIVLFAVIAVLAAAVLALVLLMNARSREFDQAKLDEQLASINQSLGEVSGRASTYQETLTSVTQALGGLSESSQRILGVGQDMHKLQDVLAAPTLRGGLGS